MIKALDNRVIIKPDEIKTELIPGFAIPETAQEVPCRGEVIDIGETVTKIQVGDHAIYGKYSGTDVEDEGIVYRVLEKRDILSFKSKIK